MGHCLENHRRTAIVAASLLAGVLSVFHQAAAAGGNNAYENAWGCSTLFSRAPIKVLNGGDREKAICLGEGKKGRQPMSRAEAWELCREQFDTTNQLIAWTSRGWHCRYYSR